MRYFLFLLEGKFLKALVICIVLDTIFGILRAIRERKLNSNIGIDGTIRKAGMLISIIFFGLLDLVLELNLIGFIPEEIRSVIHLNKVGISDLFNILFIVFEILSVFKNMIKCKLPIPKKLQKFLENVLNHFIEICACKDFKIIDCEFNGIIDFDKVVKEVDFVMIRAGFGKRTRLKKEAKVDKMFKRNVEGCIRVGLPFGIYYYSYALNEEEAKEEVGFIISTIKDYKEFITFPVAIDMEDSDNYKKNSGFPTNEVLCNICKVACDTLGNAGYYPIIYANLDYFTHYLKEESIARYNKWLAWWSKEAIEKIDKEKYQMLQYSSIGKVDGIGSNVDMNESFVEYNKLILYLKEF